MMRDSRFYLPVFAITGLLAATAQAQPIPPLAPPSPAAAQALQDSIQSRFQRLDDAQAKPTGQTAQVTAQGDHYNLSIKLAPLIKGLQPANAAFTAKLRPLGDGTLAIEDEQYPSEFEIVTQEPPPSGGTGKAPNADKPVPASYQVKLGRQDQHGTLDPSTMLVASSGGTIASVDIVKTGGQGASLSHIGRVTTQTSTRPSTEGHYDVLADVEAEGYAGQFASPQMVRSEINAERLHLSGTMTGLSVKVLQSISLEREKLESLSVPPPSGGNLTPPQKQVVRRLLLASEGLLTGGEIDEEAEGVKFSLSGHSGALGKVEITFAGHAPQDMLSANLGITLEGLTLDDLPPAFAAYLPTRVSLHPTASNLNVADLTKIALDSLSPTAPLDPATGRPVPPVADYQALFSHGGIQVGFDQLALDLGGAQLTGNGSFTLTGPQTANGAAQITAHGLDDLIARMQGDPAVARATPVLLLLKGIAKSTPDGSVWQITLQNQKLLVNGLDLSAMAGAMK